MRTRLFLIATAALVLFGLTPARVSHARVSSAEGSLYVCQLGQALLAGVASARPLNASASDLRALLTAQLGEHLILATNATGSALGGRSDEFNAAAAALDANSVDISKSIGLVYGDAAEQAFLPSWRSHIGLVVDYTTGLATSDKAKSDKAVSDLLAYTTAFGQFLNAANPNLPVDAVANLIKDHVLTLKAVIDAQAAKDYPTAYSSRRAAFAHMDKIAAPLSGAIAMQFPAKFAGNAGGADANLRAALTNLLQEHLVLATDATGAALGGRTDEFNAAAATLDANSVDISKAIGSVYGANVESAFLPSWRSHIGLVVDYTTGLATGDKAKSDKAVNDLLAYTSAFGQLLNSVSPSLPVDAVANLIKDHVLTLKSVIDAQAAKDYGKTYGDLRTAYAHMSMIADPLAATIVAQFPDKFGGAPAAAPAPMPAQLPTTGAADALPFGGYALPLIALLLAAGIFMVRRSQRAS